MLNAIRKRAGSWVVKVLLLLLVLSFAIWGIGDIFYGGQRDPAVATVGDTAIPASELSLAFDRAVNNLRLQVNDNIDREQAIQLGILQQTLQRLVAERLIDLRAREMGLTAADDTLRRMITENPAFQAAGQFDRSRFDQLLRLNGLTEEGYLALLRRDVVRAALTGSLAEPVVVPDQLVDALYRYRNEERRGRYVVVTAESIVDLPEPTEDDLAAFHEENAQRFTTPEYRGLTFVTLEPRDLLGEIEVTDEDVASEYETRIEQYRTPERRTVAQLLAPDQATIEQAAERAAEGATFAEVAAEIDGVSQSSLGTVTTGSLPPEFDEPVFAQAEGEVGAPVESTFGWHLFRVSEIEPEEVVPLDQVRDSLREELALLEAGERLPTFANQLDDELAAGTGLSEAAAVLGLEAKTLAAVDARGLTPAGEPAEALPTWPELLDVAFASPAGETSLLEETSEGGYFVLEVNDIEPPRLQSIDEVRTELIEGWQAGERRRLARERAEQLRQQVDGAALDEAADDAGIEVVAIEPLKRTDPGTDQGINRAVVRALFATEPGEAAEEVVEVDAGFALVATDEVIAADPAADPAGREQLATELENAMRSDLVAQFEAELRRAYPVEIDGATINRFIVNPEGFGPTAPAGPPPGTGIF